MFFLRNWIYILISLSLGLSFGIFSARYTVQIGLSDPTVVIGPWQSFREIDINEENPYSLAHTTLYGKLKLAKFEALYFIARKDNDNKDLSGNCEYVVTGVAPEARWWSLTVYDQHGGFIDNPAERYSYNNTNLIEKDEAKYSIAVSPNARPGNWIPTREKTPFVVMLRLYSPSINSMNHAEDITFPKIEKVSCI